MKIHYLKIERKWFERLLDKEKTCELRKNDRDFQRGDLIKFDVRHDGKYQKAKLIYHTDDDGIVWESTEDVFKITHVLNYGACEGLDFGYCVLSLKKQRHD